MGFFQGLDGPTFGHLTKSTNGAIIYTSLEIYGATVRYYIVSWDNLGVEFFEEITKHHPDNWAKENLFESLKQEKIVRGGLSFNLNALLLRAKMNHHRHYEIYVFTSEDNIGPEDIEEMFTRDPQAFADWVRANHSLELYNDRKTTKDVIV